MKVGVFGTGYVGLVLAAGLANAGNEVVGFDVDRARIRRLKRGRVPIYEPGLEELVRHNAQGGRLSFTHDPAAAMRGAAVAFVAVGTPKADSGHPDLSEIWAAGRLIGRHMDGPTVVAVKSTVPVGTGDRLERVVSEEARHPFEVVSNPEFLKEGDAVNDFAKPARVVVGSGSPWAREVMHELYAPLMRTRDRMLFMDRRSAELTKYACNAYLATRISFINQMACLCEHLGADVDLVRQGMGSDPRIGPQFLFPGLGYGGSCFPKDVRALVEMGRDCGCPMEIAEAADRANWRQRDLFIDKILRRFGEDLAGRAFGLWGLSFKPGTDDIREAPALDVIKALLDRGGEVRGCDPAAGPAVQAHFGDRVAICADMYQTVTDVDAALLLTEWPEFRNPDFERMRAVMRYAIIFDGRNLFSPEVLARHRFEHHSVGRPRAGVVAAPLAPRGLGAGEPEEIVDPGAPEMAPSVPHRRASGVA